MDDLRTDRCTPCRGGEPPLDDASADELLRQLPGWTLVEREGVKRIESTFRFADFRSAMAFAVAVGEIAEEQGHHPDLHVGWGRVRVETWTHAIGGLHRNDFILAARIEELGARSE